MKIVKLSQDYTGSFPETGMGYLGTSSVEASQIIAAFGKAPEAIRMVNEFNSNLLKNITFIYNYSGAGAYGIYLSSADQKNKTNILKEKLQKDGYDIKITEQGLTAFPKQNVDKDPEQINQDIKRAWDELSAKGGTTFGVNISKSLSDAQQEGNEINSNRPAEARDPNIWQLLAILHVGGTIVHEAVHAMGSHSEGPSEAEEQRFTQWALPKINDIYRRNLEAMGKGELFQPLIISNRTKHAKSNSWYKTAQGYYVPQAFINKPVGSDLSGRFPLGLQNSWIMMAEDPHATIENKLGRQYMSRIPKDLDQENDSIEEQLRKYTREDKKLDPKATMTELLSEGYDEDRGYISLEGLLDEQRPKPLMVPLKKAASLTKTATLFGWMNNLDYSDGSTIPGLGDRVMAWDDRDESFSQEEEWIRHQPRYNPEYDVRGFFYTWVEPRNAPQLFDDMTQDYSNTHPAKRFATQVPPEVARILSVLQRAKSKITNKEILSTRFILTEDVMPIVDKLFKDDTVKINVFVFGETNQGEDIFAVWVSGPDVTEESIENVEKHLQEKHIDREDIDEITDNLFGISEQRKSAIENIIETAKDICKDYSIKNTYIIGSYPRDIILHTRYCLIDNIDFGGTNADQNLKFGELMAEKLGVKDVKMISKNMSLSFTYKDIKVTFNGDYAPTEIKNELRKQNIPTDLLTIDVFNRNFTINMMVYDFNTNQIKDISELAERDMERKIIRTFLNPEYVCQKNPLIIYNALKYKIRYQFEIDPELKKAMINNAHLLFDGRFSDAKLIIARKNVLKEGKSEAEALFREYGIENTG
jgi:hypothetical protein